MKTQAETIFYSMKLFFIFLFFFISHSLSAQSKYNTFLLDTLQQISLTNTPAKHFAYLYYKTIQITNGYLAKQPDSVQQFIVGFESLFAPEFFRSYKNFNQQQPQVFNWQGYYADTTLNELQYQFIGMNAHINGDMWKALKNKYVYDTLVKYRKPLIRFQKVLNIFFDSIYSISGSYKKIKRLHFFTLGMDKYFGRQMILHWRKRQVSLAMLFYIKPKRWACKWKYTQKRMLHYNLFARHWIK